MAEQQKGWHFDKTISWAHVITTATIVATGIVTVMEIKGAVNTNAQAIKYLEREQAQDKRRVEEVKVEINQRFDSIDRKLDRIIERQIDR